MDATQYQNEFGRTLAGEFFPDNVSPLHVGIILNAMIQLAKAADAAKRALYYNKTDRLPDGSWANVLDLPFNIDTEQLHALLGMVGELGEIVEVILCDDGQERARARLVDENGDFSWYQALLFKPWEITFQESWDRNIAKLAQRYPDRFTTERALSRDLEAEAAVFGTITVH